MPATVIDPPTLGLTADQLVDWLELYALFDVYGVARLDALIASLRQLSEENEDDIGEEDRREEQIRESIEVEIDLRVRHLGETYPYRLSDDAEELCTVADWQEEKYTFYLVCLIASHVTGSPILKIPPAGGLLNELRNRIFQIVSTLAIAGLARGPAISVGWPRQGGERIVELLRRAAENGAGFGVREPPGTYTPPEEKDGGIDVIAWTPEVTPPPSVLFFGQAASGNNWPGKPVTEHARLFVNNYLQDVMTGNWSHVTIIPFRVIDMRFWMAQHSFHRSVIDRLRLPPRALQGLEEARKGLMVDEADQMDAVMSWLEKYRQTILA